MPATMMVPLGTTYRGCSRSYRVSEASVAKKGGQRKYTKQLKKAGDRVGAASKLDLLGKWSGRNAIQSRKESFTGLFEIDELLRNVHMLPPYVSQLELTREEKGLPRRRRREALEAKWAGLHDESE